MNTTITTTTGINELTSLKKRLGPPAFIPDTPRLQHLFSSGIMLKEAYDLYIIDCCRAGEAEGESVEHGVEQGAEHDTEETEIVTYPPVFRGKSCG